MSQRDDDALFSKSYVFFPERSGGSDRPLTEEDRKRIEENRKRLELSVKTDAEKQAKRKAAADAAWAEQEEKHALKVAKEEQESAKANGGCGVRFAYLHARCSSSTLCDECKAKEAIQ